MDVTGEILDWNRGGKRQEEELLSIPFPCQNADYFSCQEENLRSIFVPCGERLELLAPSGFVSLLVVVGEGACDEKTEKKREIGREGEGKRKARKQTHLYLLAMYYVLVNMDFDLIIIFELVSYFFT